MSDIPQQNPFEDQRKQALELYENMAKECHHWSSFIQRAIESYNPDLQAQLSAKEQENEELKKALDGGMYSEQKKAIAELENEITLLQAERDKLKKGIAGYSKEVSELHKIASDQDTELSSLRSENDRLTSEALKYFNELQHQLNQTIEAQGRNFDNDKLISELRKRCEDLEAVLTYFVEKFKNDYPGSTIALMAERGSKLLNQIKS